MSWVILLASVVVFTEPAGARPVLTKLSCEDVREEYETKVNGTDALSERDIEALNSNYSDCAAKGYTRPDPKALDERLTKHFAEKYQEAKNLFDERKVGSPKEILDLAKKAKIPQAERQAMRDDFEQTGKAGCENHDLRKSPSYPPVINQTPDNKWCYAYSLAMALSLKLGVQVSAADIALTNIRYGKRSQLNNEGGRSHRLDEGMLTEAWELTKQRGYCLESQLHSGENSYGSILDVYDKIDQAARLKTSMKNQTSCPAYGHLMESVSSAQQLKNLKDINDIDLTLEKDSAVFHLADKACGPRRKIDEKLSLQRLKPPDLKGQINIALRNGVALPMDNPVHGLVVVGSKWDQNSLTCRYLIRDSIAQHESTMFDPTAQREDDHHYWVSREQFLKDADNGTNRLFEIK